MSQKGKGGGPIEKGIKDWFKGHGHKAKRVDALPMASERDFLRAVRELHGVTEAEYRGAGGSG